MAELKKFNKLRRKRRNARLVNYKMEESGHKKEQVLDDDHIDENDSIHALFVLAKLR